MANLYTIVSGFRAPRTSRRFSPMASKARSVRGRRRRTGRPFARAAAYLAKSVLSKLSDFPPAALGDLANAWCVMEVCGGDLTPANIAPTAQATR